MKCIIAVVLLAVVISSSEASVLPWGYGYPGAWPAAVGYSAWGGPSLTTTQILAAPAIVSAPIVAAHEGSYVAANRGTVHVAPLPGHTQSAASINLAPAPGTW